MISRREMLNKENVFCPRELTRVLRAAHDKTHIRRAAGRLDEQLMQCLLSILRVRAEVRERRAINLLRRDPTMHVRIDTSVQRRDLFRAYLELERIERRSPCETQHQIKLAETVGMNVRHYFACAEPGDRDRRIKIVEDANCRRTPHQLRSSNRVGTI